MFQVFRVSALFIRGVVDVIPPFSVDLQGVSIPRRDVGACISCVQHFVRSPLFTQRSFFTDTGVGLLQTAIDTAESVCSCTTVDPWRSVMLKSSTKVISELTRCHNTVIGLRQSHPSPKERWFNVEEVASSISSSSPTRPRGVVISEYVEVGDVSFISRSQQSDDVPGPSGVRDQTSTPKRAATPAKKRPAFEFQESPVVPKKASIQEDPSLSEALDRQSSKAATGRASGRSRKKAQPYAPKFP